MVGIPVALPIEWAKPTLRLVYLVEGFYRLPTGDKRVVRWCGPKGRTGSGFTARPTLTVHPIEEVVGGSMVVTSRRENYEGRLSRCSIDKTLGQLSQTIQAMSEVTMTVDLGDGDEGPTANIDDGALRDMAIHGRWMGQQARLIVVDADDIDRWEVMADGVWDRDPDKLSAYSFRMTINVGSVIPPWRNWPQAQVPSTVDQWLDYSYASTTTKWSPTGATTPSFGLNPNHVGRWMPIIFGGVQSLGSDELWIEIVPYGSISTDVFAWVSPLFDQFVYDVMYESTSDGVVSVAATSGTFITCFNNNDPTRGPVGTCVRFTAPAASVSNGFEWRGPSRTDVAVAKVAGGRAITRPPGYTDIGFDGNPELGNGGNGSEATPTSSAFGSNPYSEVPGLLIDLFTSGDYLGAPTEIHSDAESSLLAYYSLVPGAVARTCAVPAEPSDEPLSLREAMEAFMRSIPADLVQKADGSGKRKYLAVPRPIQGDQPIHRFTVGELVETNPQTVEQLSDPDGYYSNETTIVTGKRLVAPDVGEPIVNPREERSITLSDLAEQSSSATDQIVVDEVKLKGWDYFSQADFEHVAVLLEASKSRPQRVLEAVHGYPSWRFELGDVVAYSIPGVYSDPGQIRSMRLDLDRQTVTVRTYHWPDGVRIIDTTGEADRLSKPKQDADRKTPDRDRRKD